MLNFLKKLFGAPEAKPAETSEANVSAPYKVPEPAAITPIPLVVESAPAIVTEPAPAEKPAKAKKAPAKPKEPKAPAAVKKAPAKPKAPKATP